MKLNPKLVFLFRLILGLILFYLIFRSVETEEIISHFYRVNLFWIFVTVILLILIRFLMALRWDIILRQYHIYLPLAKLIKILFISAPFGQVTPGGLGADVAKGVQLIKIADKEKLGKVATTILIDKTIGIYSLFFLALPASIIARLMGLVSISVPFLLILNLIVFTGLLLFFFYFKRIIKFLAKYRKISEKMNRLSLLLSVKFSGRSLILVILLTLIVQTMRCIVFYFLYVASGYPINFIFFLIFIPPILLLLMIPVTISGFGVREGALVFFFNSVNIPAAVSIGVGLLFQVLQIIISLPGIILWISDNVKPGMIFKKRFNYE